MSGKEEKSPIGWLLNNGVAAVAILALVIYGLAKRGVDGFYGHLNVTAEDVGLNQSVVTGRAALVLVRALTFAAGLAAFTVVIVSFATARVRTRRKGDHPYDKSDDTRWRISWGVWVALVIGVPVATLTFRYYREAIIHPWYHPLLAILYWSLFAFTASQFVVMEHRNVIAPLLRRWKGDHPNDPHHPDNDSLERLDSPYLLWKERDDLASGDAPKSLGLSIEEKVVGVIAVLALGAAGLLSLTTTVGWNRAESVIDGSGNDPNWGGLAIRSQAVCLRWSEVSAKALKSDGPYMFLGQNGDTLVLYDFEGRHVSIRIPASGVSLYSAVSTGDSQWACPAPEETTTPTS